MVTGVEGLGVSALGLTQSAGPSRIESANLTDVERFQNAMATDPTKSPSSAGAASGLATPAAIAAASPDVSLGDRILNTLETSSTRIRSAWAEADQALRRPDMQMTDMLRLQMTVLEASIQYDLLSKGISKSTQNLDQILRTQ